MIQRYQKLVALLFCAILFFGTTTLAESSAPLFGETPCIDAPYDYEFYDENRCIVIKQIREAGSDCLVADIQLSAPAYFTTVITDGVECHRLTSWLAKGDAVLGFNADYVSKNDSGIIIRNGELLRPASGSNRNLLIVNADGSFSTRFDRSDKESIELADQLLKEGVLHTFEFGPVLIENGIPIENMEEHWKMMALSRKEPRTAIGEISPLHYVAVVVDGRNPGISEGMTLFELQAFMVKTGAKTAFNLDGGGSSHMAFMGETINDPSDSRSYSDIIAF